MAFLFSGASFTAAETSRPDAGGLARPGFVEDLDGVCGLGTDLDDGCDAIRAREIADSASEPWPAIGRVNVAGILTKQHCTGTLVAPDVVLTASHCLYDANDKVWIPPPQITFVAGYARGSGVAVANGESYVLDVVQDTTSRIFRGAPDQDWALIVLADAIGNDVGYLPIAGWDDPGDITSAVFAGYAGLRPQVLSVDRDCGAPQSGFAGIIVLRCAAMPGDSGGPLITVQDGHYTVAALFSGVSALEGEIVSVFSPSTAFADAVRRIAAP